MSGISAQGSTLQISTGTGGAKTITAVAVGGPTILTSAAHGLLNGDVVTIAALTGADAALLNGLSLVVTNKTTNTFAVNVDTTGKVITPGIGTATPVTFTKINGIKSFSGLDGAPSELDTTDLDSTAMEYIAGLIDEGKFGYEAKRLNTDAGQLAVRAARASGAVKTLKLTFPDAGTATFSVFVKSVPATGGVNAVLMGSVDMKITGPVVYA